VSQLDKAELGQYNIHHFWELKSAQGKGPARHVARRIYNHINEKVRKYAGYLLGMKHDMSESRQKLAHPSIPNDKLLAFLSELGSGVEGLEQIEIEMFKCLESRSNHPDNVKLAIKGPGSVDE